MTNEKIISEPPTGFATWQEYAAHLEGRIESLGDDVLRLTQQNDAQFRNARTDRLTGLANRLAFDEILAADVERSRRTKNPLGLVIYDIDHFKHVNDTYGHPQGDAVLRALSEYLRTKSPFRRTTDTHARVGGEELSTIAYATDVERTYALAEDFRQRWLNDYTETRRQHNLGPELITFSGGVSGLEEGMDIQDLYSAADRQLYHGKQTGRNKIVYR